MKKILRQLGLIACAALLASIFFMILLDAIVMPYVVDVPSIRVPNLQGLSVSKAAVRLEKSGLDMAIGDSLHHETLPIYAVVDQDPAVGHRVKRGPTYNGSVCAKLDCNWKAISCKSARPATCLPHRFQPVPSLGNRPRPAYSLHATAPSICRSATGHPTCPNEYPT